MKSKFSTNDMFAIGIGTGLFVALTQVQIPIGISNTYLQPRMVILAFIAAVFGPVVGAAVGFIGHWLGDIIFYADMWWSWTVPELAVGIVIGFFAGKYAIQEGGFGKKEILRFNVAQVLGNVIAWLLLAPVMDIMIYREPAAKVFMQGAGACLGNVLLMGIFGTIILYGYSKINKKLMKLTD